jgi:hypothetical protein
VRPGRLYVGWRKEIAGPDSGETRLLIAAMIQVGLTKLHQEDAALISGRAHDDPTANNR